MKVQTLHSSIPAVFAALLTSSAAFAASTYRPDYFSYDASNFSTADGGVIRIPYVLSSGTDINGGQPIWVDYQFGDLSNDQSYTVALESGFTGGLAVFNGLQIGIELPWTPGDPITTSATLSLSWVTPAGYALTGENLTNRTDRFVTSNTYDYVWDTATPNVANFSHLATRTLGWNLIDDTGPSAGQTAFYRWCVGSAPSGGTTFMTFDVVPELSSLHLLAGALGLVSLRRRRSGTSAG